MKTVILSIFISINCAYSFDWNIDSPQIELSKKSVRGKRLIKSYGLGRQFSYDKYQTLKRSIMKDDSKKLNGSSKT